MIDVCPVGALTDKTFRFKSRVWFTKPLDAHRNCDKCCGKVVLFTKGDEVLRVSARKDQYGEVKEYICNECRYDHKNMKDWVIEGPRHIDRHSVISQNHYEKTDLQKLKQEIDRQIVFQKGKQLEQSNDSARMMSFFIYKSIHWQHRSLGSRLFIAAYSTYAERKVAAFLQDRIGPDRAGPFGIFSLLPMDLKFIMKEEFIPVLSNKFLFIAGPCIAMLTALMAGVVIPWGNTIIYQRTGVFPADRRSEHWHSLCLWRGFHWRLRHYDRRMGFQ